MKRISAPAVEIFLLIYGGQHVLPISRLKVLVLLFGTYIARIRLNFISLLLSALFATAIQTIWRV